MSDEGHDADTRRSAALEAEVTLAREQLAATVDALVDRGRARAARSSALKDRGRRLVFDATDGAALPEDRARARKRAAASPAASAALVVVCAWSVAVTRD